jgi:ferrous iron transport protein B
MNNIVEATDPFMTGWLGLPAVTSIPLIFGILRKELALILLGDVLSQIGMSIQNLTSVQMIVFALVTMIYIPCLATVAACIREFGWKKAVAIAVVDVALALFIGGIAYRVLSLIMPT